jgi:hypothetical protein
VAPDRPRRQRSPRGHHGRDHTPPRGASGRAGAAPRCRHSTGAPPRRRPRAGHSAGAPGCRERVPRDPRERACDSPLRPRRAGTPRSTPYGAVSRRRPAARDTVGAPRLARPSPRHLLPLAPYTPRTRPPLPRPVRDPPAPRGHRLLAQLVSDAGMRRARRALPGTRRESIRATEADRGPLGEARPDPRDRALLSRMGRGSTTALPRRALRLRRRWTVDTSPRPRRGQTRVDPGRRRPHVPSLHPGDVLRRADLQR